VHSVLRHRDSEGACIELRCFASIANSLKPPNRGCSMGDSDKDSDRGPDRESTLDNEDRVLRQIKNSFAMWAMSAEVMRASIDDWAKLRKQHLQSARKALRDIEKLPSDQKPSAANVVFEEMENSIKDFAAAAFRVMTFAEAAGQKLQQEMSRGPFGADSRQSGSEKERNAQYEDFLRQKRAAQGGSGKEAEFSEILRRMWAKEKE
jgi:hypothetical protein